MKRFLMILCFLLSACGGGNKIDYIKIAGGGIEFNYRLSEASMVLIVQQTHPMPEGSTLEALFDVPGTNTRESVKQQGIDGKLLYRFQSGKVFGLTKGGHYTVSVRLLDKTGSELDRKDRVYVSDEDQASLPSKPPEQ